MILTNEGTCPPCYNDSDAHGKIQSVVPVHLNDCNNNNYDKNNNNEWLTKEISNNAEKIQKKNVTMTVRIENNEASIL